MLAVKSTNHKNCGSCHLCRQLLCRKILHYKMSILNLAKLNGMARELLNVPIGIQIMFTGGSDSVDLLLSVFHSFACVIHH